MDPEHSSGERRRRLARAGSWVVVDNVCAAAFSFIFLVVAARVMSIAEFGVGILAVAIGQIVVATIESLFHDALIQKSVLRRADARIATLFLIGFGLLTSLLLVTSASRIAGLFEAPALAACMPWLSVAIIFSSFSATEAAKARRHHEFKMLAIRTLIGRTIGTALGLFLALTGAGMWAILSQFVVATAVSSLFLIFFTGLEIRGKLVFARLARLLKFGLPAVGTQLLLFSGARIFTLIVGAILGPAAAAIWNIGFRTIEPLHVLGATIVGQLSLPMLSRHQGDPARLRDFYMKGTHVIAMFALPVLLALSVCADNVVLILFGERWLPAVPILQIVAVVTLVTLLRQFSDLLLVAIGKPAKNFNVQLQAFGLSLAGLAVGMPWGVVTTAIGWSSRIFPLLGTSAIYLRQATGISIREQLKPVVLPLVSAAVMVAALEAVRYSGFGAPNAAFSLALQIFAGTLAYCVSILLIDRDARAVVAEATALLRKK